MGQDNLAVAGICLMWSSCCVVLSTHVIHTVGVTVAQCLGSNGQVTYQVLTFSSTFQALSSDVSLFK